MAHHNIITLYWTPYILYHGNEIKRYKTNKKLTKYSPLIPHKDTDIKLNWYELMQQTRLLNMVGS